MKELEVEVRVRNNRLKERRLDLGLTQTELALRAGIPHSTYNGLECMRDKPKKLTGKWKESASALAVFYDVEPDELFPPVTESIEKTVAARKIDAEDVGLLIGDYSNAALMSPDEHYDKLELRSRLDEALGTLEEREERILRERFGLQADPQKAGEMSSSEVGEGLDRPISSQRVRQIEAKALRKLRHPRRTRKFRTFIED